MNSVHFCYYSDMLCFICFKWYFYIYLSALYNYVVLCFQHSSDAKCIFEELHNSDPLENTYMYRSYKYKYKNYYLGFNKHGKKLKGTLPDQKRKQKCYKFLKSGSDRSFDKNEWSAQKGPRYGVEGDFTHLAITPRRRHLRHKARERRRQKADIT